MLQFYKKYLLLLCSFTIMAMEQTSEQLLQVIQQTPDISYMNQSFLKKRNKKGENVLHLACKQGDSNSIAKIFYQRNNHDTKELLFTHDCYGYLSIHKAAKYGQDTSITTLLDIHARNGGDPYDLISHKENGNCCTPLHLAVRKEHIQAVKKLIAAPVNYTNLKKVLFMKNNGRYTALHLASANNHAEITKILLEAAGNSAKEFASIHNCYGRTAVHNAILKNKREGNADVLKVFIQIFGYNILQVKGRIGSMYKDTAFDYAVKKNDANINNLLDAVSLECTICLSTKNFTDLYIMSNCNGQLGCNASFCKDCLIQCITIHLDEGSTRELKCPNRSCAQKIHASDIRAITEDRKDLYTRFLDISFDEYRVDNHHYIKFCPTPDCKCTYSVEEVQAAQRIECPGCGQVYCIICQYDHQNMSCEDAAALDHDCVSCLTRHARNMSCQAAARDRIQTEFSLEELQNIKVKPCPHCKIFIEKNQGCNHITCKKCSHEFCWTCLSTFRTTQCNSSWCDVFKIETGINF